MNNGLDLFWRTEAERQLSWHCIIHTWAAFCSAHLTLAGSIVNESRLVFPLLKAQLHALFRKPAPIPSRSYHVCATVKRRRWRMLLFTSNFLKKHGEFLGELRGEIFGDVGLFPGSLGSSSSKCICSLKVLM